MKNVLRQLLQLFLSKLGALVLEVLNEVFGPHQEA